MIFTDGQLLTADDINNFLLNRETNPGLDEAKTQALARIETLKSQIPQGGTELTTLPQGFITDCVLQAWKLSITRNNTEIGAWAYDQTIEINAPQSKQTCSILVYNHSDMRLPPILVRIAETTDSSRKKYTKLYTAREDGTENTDLYADNARITYMAKPETGISKEIFFITISQKLTLTQVIAPEKYYTKATIEEVPDDLPKLLHP